MSANPIPISMPLHMSSSTANRRTVLHCSGKLISETADSFVVETKRLAERSDTLVLDLGGLTYIDSSGLGALVRAFTSLRRDNVEFRLQNVTQRVMELLRITNLAKVLQPTTENLL